MSNVEHPSHYNMGSIECIDAIKATMTNDQFNCFLKGNAIKYLWRYEHKNKPIEDLNKTIWYINRLIKELENKKK